MIQEIRTKMQMGGREEIYLIDLEDKGVSQSQIQIKMEVSAYLAEITDLAIPKEAL